MRRTLIGAGVVLAIVVAGALSRRARTDAAPAPTSQTAIRPTPPPPRSPELPAMAAARDPRAVRGPDPQIDQPVLHARVADAHAHLQDAVKPCRALVTRGSPNAQFQFSYRLSSSGGEASVSDLSLVWSDYKSAELEKCLLENLAAARWTGSDADGSTTVEDVLTAAELE